MADTKKPKFTELSKVDHGKQMAKALIEIMIDNPDSILKSKGNGQLNIYKDLLRDDQVKSCFQQRRTAVTQSEYQVTPATESAQDKEAALFVEDMLSRIGFDQLTDKMLYAIHFGWSVAELMFTPEEGRITLDQVKVRDRGRFAFSATNDLLLKKDSKSFPMPANKFWVFSHGADHDDNPYGEGLAHSLYWPVFFKRNGIKFWLIFLEKFGMPTATAKLPSAQIKDRKQRDQALAVLDAIQADSGVVIPEDMVIELVEASRSGTADYAQLQGAMDRAISKIILSQTMTTDDGSSLSQAQVHKGVKDDIVKADADMICDSFNKQVIEPLIALNFANAQPPKVWRKTEPEEDLAQIAERDSKIMQLGYEPTEEYVKETYGPGWRKRTTPPPMPFGNQVEPMGAEFAEVSPLTQKRVQHRRDQRDIVDAGEYLASNPEQAVGPLVRKIIEFAQTAGSEEEFVKRLDELAEQDPDSEVVERVRNANIMARMRGYTKNAG